MKIKNVEKAAQRLSYLWFLREENPRKYIREGLGAEKEDIYTKYGSDANLIPMARSFTELL